eukprot:6805929-Prymnesium_polylepis.2
MTRAVTVADIARTTHFAEKGVAEASVVGLSLARRQACTIAQEHRHAAVRQDDEAVRILTDRHQVVALCISADTHEGHHLCDRPRRYSSEERHLGQLAAHIFGHNLARRQSVRVELQQLAVAGGGCCRETWRIGQHLGAQDAAVHLLA